MKRLCYTGLEPQAGNAVGLKLHPGQMVFLISSIGPLHLGCLSVFYLAFNGPGRSGAIRKSDWPSEYEGDRQLAF